MPQDRTPVHLLAGGVAGTTGAVITCPLEVVKTRLQSSCATFRPAPSKVYVNSVTYSQPRTIPNAGYTSSISYPNASNSVLTTKRSPPISVGLWHCLNQIVRDEGVRGLWKGLGPNLIGVAPSRAIYFFSYANAKKFLNSVITPETPLVHILSASCAGFTASTTTNPIWFVKTRVQLDQKRHGGASALRCAREIYREGGIRQFYKGITASYYGISETVIHFVIYEAIKSYIREYQLNRCYNGEDDRSPFDFAWFMGAGATSKTIATCIAYPHEVARTRLRQSGNKYRSFWQTLALVGREEGMPGLYRGLCTQLVRQIPNTAIMMCTYEVVVYYANLYLDDNDDD